MKTPPVIISATMFLWRPDDTIALRSKMSAATLRVFSTITGWPAILRYMIGPMRTLVMRANKS